MGTYDKNIDIETIKKAYKSLIVVLKDMRREVSINSVSYAIMCIYEYLILSVCIRYKEDGVLNLSVSEDKITINITCLNKVLDYVGYSTKHKQIIRSVMYKFLNNSNLLRHEFYTRRMALKNILLFLIKNSNNVEFSCNTLLTEEEWELKYFITNGKMFKNIYNELFDNKEMSNICNNIISGYIDNSSGEKDIKDIVKEMMHKSGCSQSFAYRKVIAGLSNHNIVK